MSGGQDTRDPRRTVARACGLVAACLGAFWLGDLLGQYVQTALPSMGALALDASQAAAAAQDVSLLPFLERALATRPLGLSLAQMPVCFGAASVAAVLVMAMKNAIPANDEPELGDGACFEQTPYRQRYAHLAEEVRQGREVRPWPKPAWCERLEDDNLIVTDETRVGLTPNPIFALKVPNMHGYMIAGSGSGKTYGFIQTNAMQLNGSAFFTDPKCENFYLLAPLYASHGYDVKYLDLRGAGAMEWSQHYNPMHYVDQMSDITELVDMLIDNTTPEGASPEPFFPNMEKIVYTCLLGYFLYFFKKRGNEADCNLPLMLDYLAYTKESPGRMTGIELIFYGTWEKDGVVGYRQWLVEEVCGGDEAEARRRPEWAVLTMYDAFVATAKSPETMASVVSSCYARLKDFANPLVREMMSTDDLELADFGRRRMVFFGIVPDGGAGSFAFIAAMALHQLFHVNMQIADSSKSRHLDIPIMCYLDELANIGKLPMLGALFATLRSRWINLYAIVQDTGQLKTVYGEGMARAIYSNAAVTLYYGNSDLESAEQISKEIGTHTIWFNSKTYSSGAGGRTVSMTRQHQVVPLVSAAQLNNGWLENTRCLTHYKSSGWYKGTKPDPTKHPRWQERVDAQAALDAEIDRLGCNSPTEAWARLSRERKAAREADRTRGGTNATGPAATPTGPREATVTSPDTAITAVVSIGGQDM